MVDDAFGDRHLREISMTRSALHACADMRRMIEPHVRFFDEPVYPLPWYLFAALRVVAQRLNPRVGFKADAFVTCHAEVDARETGARSALHSCMTFVAFDSDLIGLMNPMRKVYRLLRFGFDA